MSKTKRIPTVKKTEETIAHGLTLHHTVTRAFTFTVAQLKYACTVDRVMGFPVSLSRDKVNDVLKSVVRANRWELFGNHEPYRIIFNGYGQFKYVDCEAVGVKLSATEVFNILDKLYLTETE